MRETTMTHPTPASGHYTGKVTPVGNSKGIRLDARFFKAHPEFDGEVRATVLADGQVLLSANSKRRRAPRDADADPGAAGLPRLSGEADGRSPRVD